MHTSAAELLPAGEEPLVQAHLTAGADVDLGHPCADAVGMELVVPGAVERVREVDPPSVAAHLDHLRAAREWFVGGCGMRCVADDSPEAHGADLTWPSGIGDVVLLELTGPPARDVEEAIVDRQVDVGDERRNRPERL